MSSGLISLRIRLSTASPARLQSSVFCGETDYVTERLSELESITGIDHVLCWTRLGGLADDLVTGHMERMRDDVMPALR